MTSSHRNPLRRIALTGLAVITLAMSGCATQDYEHYANAQASMAQAQSATAVARYAALERIAVTGDSVARVAAVMGLAGLGSEGHSALGGNVAAPTAPGSTALQWASVLVPGLTQAYMISANVKLGMRQSDNATALGLGQSRDQTATSTATFAAFGNLASHIQAPAANVNTTTNTTAPTTNTTITTNSLSGSGVIGAGSYSIGPNSGAQSGNSGRLAGQGITEATATPTIVRPEIVTQPAPLVVQPEIVRPEIVTPVPPITPVTP